jgi:hypothetical protein
MTALAKMTIKTKGPSRRDVGEQIANLASLTDVEREIINNALRAAKGTYGYEVEPHQCFRNAQSVLISDHDSITGSKSLRYFEGYLPSPDGAAPHAWIEINGKPVDITLMSSEEGLRLLEKNIPRVAGREVPINQVRRHFQLARVRGHCGVLGLRLTPL